ncbi:MAG TPA: Hsp20/alpha crystallin family protein [Opitutaceae bacterium]|jgi:HSP20 family protein|nr:Hsp20/alpha crystallin family protein [Opitutaceae bacterium]
MRLIQYSYPNTRVAPSLGLGRSPWAGLESEIDRLFETALGGFPSVRSSGHQFPVDLYEDANSYYVRAELPGVAREDVNVEIVDGILTVTAARRQKTGEQEQSFSFSRSVNVPDQVQSDKVAAAFENGILTVTLPKREESKPRKVSVQVN